MQIFQKPEDYCDWEKLIAHCDILEGLGESDRRKTRQAFEFLREEFGSSFLRRAYRERHPIFHYLFNTAPWTRIWITSFAGAIRDLKSANPDNFRALSKRLADSEKFTEGMSVLETGYALFKAGFAVTFDVPISETPNSKIPDLKIADPLSRQEIFVEVSVQHQARQESEAQGSFDRILFALTSLDFGLEFSGRLHRTLSQRHLGELIGKISELAERSNQEQSFREFVEEDVIELAIAPAAEFARLEQWAAARGLKPREFIGAPYDSAEIVRTKMKVREKLKQLPPDRPGMICLFNGRLFLHARDIKVIIRELEELIYDCPQVSILIVIGQWFGDWKEKTDRVRDHTIIVRSTSDGFSSEAHLILSNKFAHNPIPQESWDRICVAFEEHFGI
jgi:hypothetical protein